jgi:hypothetical protein
MKEKDFTKGGIKIDGAYENDRNADSAQLFKEIIREACGVHDVIIAHHLVYVRVEQRDGFDYQIVEEIPSADALIFDHDIAQKLWGEAWRENLVRLVMEPAETRDVLLASLYRTRGARLAVTHKEAA